MLNPRYLLIPFVLQALAMSVDEFRYHRKRPLPRWERVGHPIDTFTVLLCFAWLFLSAPSRAAVAVYTGLCVLSCLSVVKDEDVHQRLCTAGEHRVHAMLFILHPLVLLAAGLLWPGMHGPAHALPWLHHDGSEGALLLGCAALTLLYGFYQLIYWNWIWKPASDSAAR